jgi:enoyl-CoA hydratase/carnithine racemase
VHAGTAEPLRVSPPEAVAYLLELLRLGLHFETKRAAELGVVTRVVPAHTLLATATDTAQQLAEKPAGALQVCKRLLKQSSREQIEQAIRVENEEFTSRLARRTPRKQ